MSKKRKHKKVEVRERKSKKTIFWIIGAVVVTVVVIFVISSNILFSDMERAVDTSGTEEKKDKSFYVQGGESRPVLNPEMFTGTVRVAYAAAKKYPEVMDQVHCYCYCDEPPFYHKSLLSCFTEKHGAG
jgi:hypothetical protein